MNKTVFTNVDIYKSIADESYEEMIQLVSDGRKPKPDGSPGWIVRFDPDQKSFKKAMVSIVFTGMWIEAITHLLIVNKFGEKKFKEFERQRKTYEDKLILLGITDQSVIEKVNKFRTSRNELVHEKAYFDKGKIKTAQKEAECAHELLHAIHAVFLKSG